MSGLFTRKKRPLVVPPAPHEMPTFPSLPEIEDKLEEPEHFIDDLELPSSEPEFSESNQMSTFVKMETFQAVLADVVSVRSRLDKSVRVVMRLEEVHEEQNNLLKSWQSDIKVIHEKLNYIDNVLFKRG